MNEQEAKDEIITAPNKSFLPKYFFKRLLLVWPGSWLYFSLVGGAICKFLGFETDDTLLPLVLRAITAGIGAWFGGRWYCEAMNKAESGVGNKSSVQFAWFFVRPTTFIVFLFFLSFITITAELPNPYGILPTTNFIIASLGAWACGHRFLQSGNKGIEKSQNGNVPSSN